MEVVNPAIFQDRPQFFAQLGSKAYFAMDEMIVESDGTVSGTKYLYDIGTDDTVISILSQPVVMNNKMYFMGGMNLKSGSTVLKDELYVSDGTKAGTKLVYDHDSRGIEHMVTNGGKLFYTANTTAAGNELWISDGTAAGTKMWKDLRPGLAKGFKGPMLAVGNYVLFQADGGPNGNELWQYDLNNSIGVITGDINPGSSSSNPQDFAEAGGKLFFRATAPNIGSELFVYTPIFIADTSTSGVTPPAAPSGFVASMGATSSDGNITVTWTDNSSDETAFLLETSADGSTNWTFVDSVGADVKTYDHVGLTAASVHYYRVKASKSGTHSAYSNVDSAMASTKDSSGTNPGSGINELDNSHSLKIFPNPANSSITLSREANANGEIQIFNAIGLEVMKQSWKQDNNSFSLDISELPKGMYILTYSTSTEQTSLRLVKE